MTTNQNCHIFSSVNLPALRTRMCTSRCSQELSWRGSASFRSLARISRASANKKKMKKMHSEFPFRTSCRNASPCPLPLVALKKSLPNHFSETKSTGRLQNHEDTPRATSLLESDLYSDHLGTQRRSFKQRPEVEILQRQRVVRSVWITKN